AQRCVDARYARGVAACRLQRPGLPGPPNAHYGGVAIEEEVHEERLELAPVGRGPLSVDTPLRSVDVYEVGSQRDVVTPPGRRRHHDGDRIPGELAQLARALMARVLRDDEEVRRVLQRIPRERSPEL